MVKTFFDCIPCFIRQALDAVRMVTDDEQVHGRLLQEVLRAASEMDLSQSPPAMGQHIHRQIRQLTGDKDPYREIKCQHNRLALQLYPELRARVYRSDSPLETALRLAIAGNVIDLGVNTHLEETQVFEAIEQSLALPLDGDADKFAAALDQAESIMYLADNAGEIAFDRLLLEQIPSEKVTLVVRGSPVINDATMADAQVAGIPGLVEVIDNGSDAPGTILEDCSAEFRRSFERSDLIIAKGQGNYETLSDEPKDIFFVLKAKCPVIARDLGCQVGSLVLRRSTPAPDGSVAMTGIDRAELEERCIRSHKRPVRKEITTNENRYHCRGATAGCGSRSTFWPLSIFCDR
ncbi:MAG: ARMT1-like domain-containing protein [Planctomycetota bacterium]